VKQDVGEEKTMDASEEYTFAELLRQFRVREGMSQQQLANTLGVHRNTIGAWERGDYLPETTELIYKLAEALSLNAKDTESLLEATHERITLRIIWNVPHQPNPLFIGREAVFAHLHTQLHKRRTVALTQTHAIHGLGGIGKTQTAVEYAHRHRNDYQAILWVQADTQDALISGFVSLAALLRLPEKNEQDIQRIVDAVKRWLSEHTQWLLVLDNVEDMRVVKTFLPTTYSGHILLTTRLQALGGMAQGIMLEQMEPHEGVLFLLRRATIIGLDETLDHVDAADMSEATAIVEELGGLPLALDQAGAYIEETQCSLSDYGQRYRIRRALLLKRRGGLVVDHPEPVATTWSLSFEKVEQQSPAAADLLRLCTFLHSDAIPIELFTKGASHLGPFLAHAAEDPVALDETIAVLGNYSLIRRDARDKTISIHRLVQAVLKDAMSEAVQGIWAQRMIYAVNAAFPAVEKFTTWQQCERYLLQALACAGLIEQGNITLLEAASLLYRVGWYLDDRTRYREAEPLLVRALAIREQQLGPDHSYTASSLNGLAELYEHQGKYEQAASLYMRALAICEQQLGPQHLNTATGLNNLAILYNHQGKYEQAEPLLVRALTIREQQLGPQHPDIADLLTNLAGLYRAQGKYEEAEPLAMRALAICEQQLGPQHPGTAQSLHALAVLYHERGRNKEAEPLYMRALTIRKQTLGPEHRDTIQSLNNLGALYFSQGKYEQAESLLQLALTIRKQQLEPQHPNIAQSLNNLALLYEHQEKYEQAELLYINALAICEQQLGPQHPDTASSLNNLAELYRVQGKYEQAEPLLVRALAICEQQLGPQHPDTAQSLNNLGALYRAQGKYEQAESSYVRALAIYERKLGPQHPDTAVILSNLAELYQAQGEYKQAESLSMRALATSESALGSHHSRTRTIRRRYASLLRAMGREADALQEETQVQDATSPS
jgi:tetratricopeptide (TPR) repeat protein/DNA-binding XRE family transcriptional regulator